MRGGKSKSAARGAAKETGKRKASEKAENTAKRGKTGKDAGKPKRPPSAFFVFMEEFRKDFQAKHPNNKKVSVVSKAGGDKWKSMPDSEKAPYVDEAAKRKAEYEKILNSYNKKQSGAEGNESAEDEVEGEASDKSKSEVDDEEDDGEEEDDD